MTGGTFFKACVHCPWWKHLLWHSVRNSSWQSLRQLYNGMFFLFILLLRNIQPSTWSYSRDRSLGWLRNSSCQTPYAIWDVSRIWPQQVLYRISRRRSRAADKLILHGKNSLEQKACLTFTVLLQKTCRRVMETYHLETSEKSEETMENMWWISMELFLGFSAVFGRFPNSGKAMTEMPVHFSLCVLGAKIGRKIWNIFMLDMSFLLPATILDQGERPQKKILCYGVRIHKDPPRIFVWTKNGDGRYANENQDVDIESIHHERITSRLPNWICK